MAGQLVGSDSESGIQFAPKNYPEAQDRQVRILLTEMTTKSGP